ncbi:uncharacterized protein ASCRUDRAFT_67496 [Ascoidea rubescens DSM 1968]|uniref:CAP-Gly domain-containing protein n=1 Tax=Ascoidea rubescens DSM 1968 TaxID=1344418 RepID=A0A1D2VP97_9ASCO|nr:hypothetical protein ASCRUDRAFT_67496 [Ascoidea rubescens DSM 1968]ODV63387.1 hypothetical protein ASCRUDRAFT_67496 [Ascoidea rubescens DSM 1968]
MALLQLVTNDSGELLILNQNVYIRSEPGIIKFIGQTKFADGIWIGIELSNSIGKNNGSINGVSYFQCDKNINKPLLDQKNYGVFAKPKLVSLKSSLLNRNSVSFNQNTNKQPSIDNNNNNNTTTATANNNHKKSPSTNLPYLKKNYTLNQQDRLNSLANTTTNINTNAPNSTINTATNNNNNSPIYYPVNISRNNSRNNSRNSSRVDLPYNQKKLSNNSRPSSRIGLLTHSKTTSRIDLMNHSRNSSRIDLINHSRNSSRIDLNNPSNLPNSSNPSHPYKNPSRNNSISNLSNLSRTSSRNSPISPSSFKSKTTTTITNNNNNNNNKSLVDENKKLQSIIVILQEKTKNLNIDLNSLLNNFKNLSTENIDLKRKIDQLDENLEILTIDKETLDEKNEILIENFNNLNLKYQDLKKNYLFLQNQLNLIKNLDDQINNQLIDDNINNNELLSIDNLLKSNKLLETALIKLRDVSQENESVLNQKITDLSNQLSDYNDSQKKIQSLSNDLNKSKSQISNLQSQLDSSLDSIKLIESLTEKNFVLEEKNKKLIKDVEELEDLKNLAEDIEEMHNVSERELRDDITKLNNQLETNKLKLLEVERKNNFMSEIIIKQKQKYESDVKDLSILLTNNDNPINENNNNNSKNIKNDISLDEDNTYFNNFKSQLSDYKSNLLRSQKENNKLTALNDILQFDLEYFKDLNNLMSSDNFSKTIKKDDLFYQSFSKINVEFNCFLKFQKLFKLSYYISEYIYKNTNELTSTEYSKASLLSFIKDFYLLSLFFKKISVELKNNTDFFDNKIHYGELLMILSKDLEIKFLGILKDLINFEINQNMSGIILEIKERIWKDILKKNRIIDFDISDSQSELEICSEINSNTGEDKDIISKTNGIEFSNKKLNDNLNIIYYYENNCSFNFKQRQDLIYYLDLFKILIKITKQNSILIKELLNNKFLNSLEKNSNSDFNANKSNENLKLMINSGDKMLIKNLIEFINLTLLKSMQAFQTLIDDLENNIQGNMIPNNKEFIKNPINYDNFVGFYSMINNLWEEIFGITKKLEIECNSFELNFNIENIYHLFQISKTTSKFQVFNNAIKMVSDLSEGLEKVKLNVENSLTLNENIFVLDKKPAKWIIEISDLFEKNQGNYLRINEIKKLSLELDSLKQDQQLKLRIIDELNLKVEVLNSKLVKAEKNNVIMKDLKNQITKLNADSKQMNENIKKLIGINNLQRDTIEKLNTRNQMNFYNISDNRFLNLVQEKKTINKIELVSEIYSLRSIIGYLTNLTKVNSGKSNSYSTFGVSKTFEWLADEDSITEKCQEEKIKTMPLTDLFLTDDSIYSRLRSTVYSELFSIVNRLRIVGLEQPAVGVDAQTRNWRHRPYVSRCKLAGISANMQLWYVRRQRIVALPLEPVSQLGKT